MCVLHSNSVETGSHWVPSLLVRLKCDSPQQIQVQHANAAKEMLTGCKNQERERGRAREMESEKGRERIILNNIAIYICCNYENELKTCRRSAH